MLRPLPPPKAPKTANIPAEELPKVLQVLIQARLLALGLSTSSSIHRWTRRPTRDIRGIRPTTARRAEPAGSEMRRSEAVACIARSVHDRRAEVGRVESRRE